MNAHEYLGTEITFFMHKIFKKIIEIISLSCEARKHFPFHKFNDWSRRVFFYSVINDRFNRVLDMSKWKRHANKFLRFLLQHDYRCYFAILSADRHERVTWNCLVRNFLNFFEKFPPPCDDYSTDIFGVHESIREVSEHETRGKSLVRVSILIA